MCTISTCFSTSRSGSPMSRMVTSQPPHMANHSSASRAAILCLPYSLELVAAPFSFPTISYYCVRYGLEPSFLALLHHPCCHLCPALRFKSQDPPAENAPLPILEAGLRR